ncbi:MAG: universal stress protein [Bauldia sp.]|nr:universal stress protein [Bauldia sp.]
MYSSILVANDGSTLGRKAFRHGLELASHLGARLTVVVAIEPVVVLFGAGRLASNNKNPAQQELQARSEDARLMLDDCARMAAAEGVTCQTELVVETHPADAILQTSAKVEADLIVMASHGHRGFRQWILGSQTSEVLARSETPVLVVR